MSETFSKQYNSIRAGYSLAASVISGRQIIKGMPVALGLELSSHCNLNCPECPAGSGLMKRERGFMALSLFGKIINEMKPYLWNINLYFQGEPMMHPDFFSFLDAARPVSLTISTNGHFLTEENCRRLVTSGPGKIIVSLDGMDSSAYLRYREGGNFDTVVKGIRNLAAANKKAGSRVKIVIQYLVNRFNEHQVGMAEQFALENGCTLSLKSMQVSDLSRAGEWMPSGERYRRYRTREGKTVIKSSLSNRCARAWLNPVVTWDGKVLPCCFDKDADHIMGDLNNHTMKEVWNGEKFQAFRENILKNRSAIEICRNCTSGLKRVRT